jgi:hypothetical protein
VPRHVIDACTIIRYSCCLCPGAQFCSQTSAIRPHEVVLCRPVVLSVLADLLVDKRSHPFFLEWHAPASSGPAAAAEQPSASLTSSTGLAGSLGAPQPRKITAAQLLIGMWREQDQARGLSGPHGLLANPSRPLAGSGARTKWAVGDAGVAGGYGVLQPGRKAVLTRIAEASCPDLLMDKVGLGETCGCECEGQLQTADGASTGLGDYGGRLYMVGSHSFTADSASNVSVVNHWLMLCALNCIVGICMVASD